MKEEREQHLIGTIEKSYTVARRFLKREDNRYKRELEQKELPIDQGTVQQYIAIYGNLVAAEEALNALSIRVKDLQTRGGQ